MARKFGMRFFVDSNDSNKTGMRFTLSRNLFEFGVFVAAAEFRLGFGRC